MRVHVESLVATHRKRVYGCSDRCAIGMNVAGNREGYTAEQYWRQEAYRKLNKPTSQLINVKFLLHEVESEESNTLRVSHAKLNRGIAIQLRLEIPHGEDISFSEVMYQGRSKIRPENSCASR